MRGRFEWGLGAIARLGVLGVLAAAGVGISPASAQASTGDETSWVVCSLKASGGAGTHIALLVTEPFAVRSAKAKDYEEAYIGGLFDKDVGIATVIPGYREFYDGGSQRCAVFDEAGARAEYSKRMNSPDNAIIRSLAWRPAAEAIEKPEPAAEETPPPEVEKTAEEADLDRQPEDELAATSRAVEAAREAEERARREAAEQERREAAERERREAEEKERREAEEKERREVEETARLNREVAEFAAKQVAENEASRRRAEEGRKAYEEELARLERENDEYERAVERSRREREAANRAQQEYFAAQRRHAACVAGDRKACADIEAGKPAMEEASAAESASTDPDATRCVSSPVVSADRAFARSTQAVVVNGCEVPVDVRICLMRTGGWNCGVAWDLAPQARWTHTSFESDGQVFWDARVSTSSRPLARP